MKGICAHTNCGDVSATVVFNNDILSFNVVAIEKVIKQNMILCIFCFGCYVLNSTKFKC